MVEECLFCTNFRETVSKRGGSGCGIRYLDETKFGRNQTTDRIR